MIFPIRPLSVRPGASPDNTHTHTPHIVNVLQPTYGPTRSYPPPAKDALGGYLIYGNKHLASDAAARRGTFENTKIYTHLYLNLPRVRRYVIPHDNSPCQRPAEVETTPCRKTLVLPPRPRQPADPTTPNARTGSLERDVATAKPARSNATRAARSAIRVLSGVKSACTCLHPHRRVHPGPGPPRPRLLLLLPPPAVDRPRVRLPLRISP